MTTSTWQPHAAGPVGRVWLSQRWTDGALLLGLAGVFLVNALVAVLQPSDFTGLVERSLLGRWFPLVTGDWAAWAIGINDGLVGACLVMSIFLRRVRTPALAWAGIWLFAVTVIKVTSLHAFGG